jgi:putative ABC transport system permease protein
VIPHRIGLVFQLFLRSSRVQRKRAVLTIAAIAWGSVSLLLLLAFGEGLKLQLTRAKAGMGSDIAVLWPGETTKPWRGLPPGRPIRPKLDDLEMLRERVAGHDGIIGEIVNWGANFTNGKKTVNAQLVGASVLYGEVRNHIPRAGGRFLNDQDEAERRRSIFLGDELAGDLFGKDVPVGRTVLVSGLPYTVVGVLTKKLQMGTYGGPDKNHAVIPITTFRAQFGRDRLNNIVVRPKNRDEMKAVVDDLRKVLAAKYAFDPDDKRTLGVWDTVEDGAVMDNILIGIQLFLGIIGGLTLMIGGVGVANIMYATVKERTREIGVKMALGARPSWITGPLLLEGLSYTLVGGLIGTIVATGLVVLLGLLPTEGNEALEMLGKPTLSPAIGIVSAAVLGCIGLLAGYFPARRAASIDPAETLRYE